MQIYTTILIYANIDSINSYLGMIKGTSDLGKARELLDAVTRRGVEKDYINLKIKLK